MEVVLFRFGREFYQRNSFLSIRRDVLLLVGFNQRNYKDSEINQESEREGEMPSKMRNGNCRARLQRKIEI